MPATEKQMTWDRDNTVQVKLKLNKSNDSDIIRFLESCPNRQGMIKELIRAEIERITQK